MEKALARNPNLLRTLLGLSASLILVLAYAVYSASLNSEYYMFETSLDESETSLTPMGENNSTTLLWTTTTEGSVSWVNFTVGGLSDGSTIEVTSGGSRWWSHPSLGDADAERFACLEPNSDFEMINRCDYSFIHQREIGEEGSITLYGLVSDQLPLSGKGTIRAENLSSAESSAEVILSESSKEVTWQIKVTSPDTIDRDDVDLSFTIVTHQLISVKQFKLNPFIESVWSLTALMTCFVLALGLPFGIYYAATLREKRVELERTTLQEEE